MKGLLQALLGVVMGIVLIWVGLRMMFTSPRLSYTVNEQPVSEEEFRRLPHRVAFGILIILGGIWVIISGFLGSGYVMLGTANLVFLVWLLVNARMWTRKGVWMWLLLSCCVLTIFLLGPSLLQFMDTQLGTATTGVQQTLLRTDDGVARWARRFAPLEIVLAIAVRSKMTSSRNGVETSTGCWPITLPLALIGGGAWWLLTGRPGFIFGPFLTLHHQFQTTFESCQYSPVCWLWS